MAKKIHSPLFDLLPEPLLLTASVREAALAFLSDRLSDVAEEERSLGFLRACLEVAEDRSARMAIIARLQREQRLLEIGRTRRALANEKKRLTP